MRPALSSSSVLCLCVYLCTVCLYCMYFLFVCLYNLNSQLLLIVAECFFQTYWCYCTSTSHFRCIHACDDMMQLASGNVIQPFLTIFPCVKTERKKRAKEQMAGTKCRWCTSEMHERTTDRRSQT